MLDSLKDLENNFYAIWGLYGSNQDNLNFKRMIDMNELLEKLDEQIKVLEDERYEESVEDYSSLEFEERTREVE